MDSHVCTQALEGCNLVTVALVQSSNRHGFRPICDIEDQNSCGRVVQISTRCTTLQTGRSRVRFPMGSLEFFSDIILPVAL